MAVKVKINEHAEVNFPGATYRISAAGTLVVTVEDGTEVGMYPAGMYMDVSGDKSDEEG